MVDPVPQLEDLNLEDGTRENIGGRHTYVCPIEKIPVADETFDFVLCTQVLEHVPDPLAAAIEMRRVLNTYPAVALRFMNIMSQRLRALERKLADIAFKSVPQRLATVLLKMDPGAGLPDHEHVLIEQTYMLEGRLVDQEGPDTGIEAGPGDFIWRPAGSRHAVRAPEGALMIAAFQIPNKFFEKDGSIVDQLGEDWGTSWSTALAKHLA